MSKPLLAFIQAVLCATVFLTVERANAFESHFFVGYGWGGSDLSSATGKQGYNLTAGKGVLIGIGTTTPLSQTIPHWFELQFDIGIMYGDAEAAKNEVTWFRFPLEVASYYRNTQEDFRLGWGATYHIGNRLHGEGVNASATREVNNALGWFVSAEKILPPANSDENTWSSIGIRYQSITYQAPRFSSPVNGDGVLVTLTFGGLQ